MQNINPQEFRNALGMFATGVTIMTTADNNGNPAGVTASSFNSVSMEPPLIMWALGNERQTMPAFKQATHFAVHVLGQQQQALSNSFARTGIDDKFANVGYKKNTHGVPLLSDYLVRFECQIKHQYAGGDHIIFVGEVEAFHCQPQSALVFHQGSYGQVLPAA